MRRKRAARKPAAASGPVVLELIETRGTTRWYWFHESMVTPKGNWRKTPDGVYFDPMSKGL